MSKSTTVLKRSPKRKGENTIAPRVLAASSLVSEPSFKRLSASIKGEAVPQGIAAIVLLRYRGDYDGYRTYSWWAVAGPDNKMTCELVGGEHETLRIDWPKGLALSSAALLPYLRQFLSTGLNSILEGPPPIIRD